MFERHTSKRRAASTSAVLLGLCQMSLKSCKRAGRPRRGARESRRRSIQEGLLRSSRMRADTCSRCTNLDLFAFCIFIFLVHQRHTKLHCRPATEVWHFEHVVEFVGIYTQSIIRLYTRCDANHQPVLTPPALLGEPVPLVLSLPSADSPGAFCAPPSSGCLCLLDSLLPGLISRLSSPLPCDIS